MRKWRLGLLVATSVAISVLWTLAAEGAASPGGGEASSRSTEPRSALELYYSNPLLVRAGERVRIPVDAVCVTSEGAPCDSTVALEVREAESAGWRSGSAAATPALQFDVTASAARSVGMAGSGFVEFRLRAESGGATAALPSVEVADPLRLYVTERMPVLRMPAVTFGEVREPTTVLYLPWGTGTDRAGLSLGNESLTLGPSSFDVDEEGRIHLLDGLQDRLAVFAESRLVRESRVVASPRSSIAVSPDGGAFVLDEDDDVVSLARIDGSGKVIGTTVVGRGIAGQVRTVAGEPYVNVYPLDAWVTASFEGGPSGGTAGDSDRVFLGMPTASGAELLRIGHEDRIRLGMVMDGRVTDAVEIRSEALLGGLLLAESDGRGGYWVVVHTWQEAPTRADQYQVLHVAGGRIVSTFSVGDDRFAETPPLSRFRLGADGALYQMRTSPDGMRIVRFDLEEE